MTDWLLFGPGRWWPPILLLLLLILLLMACAPAMAEAPPWQAEADAFDRVVREQQAAGRLTDAQADWARLEYRRRVEDRWRQRRAAEEAAHEAWMHNNLSLYRHLFPVPR